MHNNRSVFIPGGKRLFIVNLLQRRGINLLVREIDLRQIALR